MDHIIIMFVGLSLHQTVGARAAVTLAASQYYQGEPNLTLCPTGPKALFFLSQY